MQVNNLSSNVIPAAAASSTSSSTTSTPLGNPNLFISLLTAQLQAQDPLNPMSPQDMVNQLTQVSSLQQLISINQTLTNLSTGTLHTKAAATNPASTTL